MSLDQQYYFNVLILVRTCGKMRLRSSAALRLSVIPSGD